ncbi:MAG: hypothetical protein LBL47_03850 [Lactobacillus sp.]|nr:hypothetical protein [Lactobacillus sp.]
MILDVSMEALKGIEDENKFIYFLQNAVYAKNLLYGKIKNLGFDKIYKNVVDDVPSDVDLQREFDLWEERIDEMKEVLTNKGIIVTGSSIPATFMIRNISNYNDLLKVTRNAPLQVLEDILVSLEKKQKPPNMLLRHLTP